MVLSRESPDSHHFRAPSSLDCIRPRTRAVFVGMKRWQHYTLLALTFVAAAAADVWRHQAMEPVRAALEQSSSNPDSVPSTAQ